MHMKTLLIQCIIWPIACILMLYLVCVRLVSQVFRSTWIDKHCVMPALRLLVQMTLMLAFLVMQISPD